MKALNKDNLITIGFYGGLAVKAVNAVIEFISGFLMLILSHDMLNRLIWFAAVYELREDPKDILMNYFIKLGNNLSISAQHAAALYMLLHGITKLLVIWLLLKRKLWAYPVSIVVFSLFIAYEAYSYVIGQSLLMLFMIVIDLAIVAVVFLEYKRLKKELV